MALDRAECRVPSFGCANEPKTVCVKRFENPRKELLDRDEYL